MHAPLIMYETFGGLFYPFDFCPLEFSVCSTTHHHPLSWLVLVNFILISTLPNV